MWGVLAFRIFLLFGFLLSAWKWGDWRNWQKYYPTIMFVMVANLSVALLTYQHPLWAFPPDAMVATDTVVQFLSAYLVLPATVLTYLSHFPSSGKTAQCRYYLLWVFIYTSLEFIDVNFVGSIAYHNGWSFAYTVLFDFCMFATIRVHYINPLAGWGITLFIAVIGFVAFGFGAAEMK